MAKVIKALIEQSDPNVAVVSTVPTYIAPDGNIGWNILGWSVLVRQLANGVDSTKNCSLLVQLNAETGSQSFTDNDQILFTIFQTHGVIGSTGAFGVTSKTTETLVAPRLTVQPNLFLYLETSNMLTVQVAEVVIWYDEVKLTPIEMMRLQQGGA